jgi:hypothetical protein
MTGEWHNCQMQLTFDEVRRLATCETRPGSEVRLGSVKKPLAISRARA